MKEKVYVDACVWISFYKRELTVNQQRGMEFLLTGVDSGSFVLVGSALLYMQLMTVSAGDLERLFDGRKSQLLPLDEGMAQAGRQFQQKCYNAKKKVLGTEDAAHLTAASLAGCKQFVTLDKKPKNGQLAPLGEKSILEKIFKLRIIEPDELVSQTGLFTDLEDE